LFAVIEAHHLHFFYNIKTILDRKYSRENGRVGVKELEERNRIPNIISLYLKTNLLLFFVVLVFFFEGKKKLPFTADR